jgi:hypothetical protein
MKSLWKIVFRLFIKQLFIRKAKNFFLLHQESQTKVVYIPPSLPLYTPDKSRVELKKCENNNGNKQSLSENRIRCEENYFLSKSKPLEFKIKAQVRININKHLEKFQTSA